MSPKTWIFTTTLLFACFLFISSVESNERFKRVCKDREIQILTDVDDTLKASGTNFVAGVDTRWPGGSLYAGLGYFYLELSRGPNESKKPLSPGVVSARPEQLAGSFPDVEKEFLIAAKATKGIPTDWAKIKIILPGEIDDNLHLHSEKRYRDYADTKVRNVKKFAAANPDKCIFFMGDNGQGDQLAGKQMLDDLPDQVAAIFIHNVTNAPPLLVDPWENIFLFTTYVDAASQAYAEGFLAEGSVLRVLQGSLKSKQFEDCRACFPKDGDQTTMDKIKCLLSDVEPKFDAEGGGCSNLFDAMQTVAEEVAFAELELPVRRVLRAIEEAEVGFFAALFSWFFWKSFNSLFILALAVLILAFFYRFNSTKEKAQ